jgi:hypothetical protein
MQQQQQQACFPYILPLLDGVGQGRNIYALVPALGTALYTVLGSTLAIYKGVPFLSFGVFIALTFAARNQVSSKWFVPAALLASACCCAIVMPSSISQQLV